MRDKNFSELQKKKKDKSMKKYGFTILEETKSDILVKDPAKVFIDIGTKVTIEELVMIHDCNNHLINSKEFKLLNELVK